MKKFIKVFLLFITSITLSSCTKYLDEIPQGKFNDAEKWIDTPIYDQNKKLMPKVEGLRTARLKYENLLDEAEDGYMEWEEKAFIGSYDYIVQKVPESQLQYIRDRIKELDNEIYDMENQNRTEAKKAKAVAENKRLEAEEKAKAVVEKKRLEAEEKAKAVAENKRLEAEEKAKAVARKKRLEAEEKVKAVAEKKNSFYLKAGVGGTNHTSNQTGSYKNTVMDGSTKNDFTSKINVDSDVLKEIGFGRDFGGIRTDITYSDQTKPIKSHGSTSFCYTDPDGIGNCYDATTSSGKKKIRNRNLMFNLEKDIPIGNSNKLTPFVGFGIGNSNISTPDREIVSERGGTKIIEPIKGGSTNKVIYQVTAGVNYNLTDNVSIYNKVQMLSTPSYSINNSSYKASKEYSINAGVKINL